MNIKTIQKWILAIMLIAGCVSAGELEIIYKPENASARINYAVDQVRVACDEVSAQGTVIFSVQGVGEADNLKPEGFRLKSLSNGSVEVVGADQSGVLYGCLELADRIRKTKAMPAKLDLTDAPEFKLRGPCIGMQKLIKDPYGGHYHWPFKPEYFPFFYDKAHWREYLDFLVGIRMNSLTLWNGHPFSSLVKLDDYPEAIEVSPETLTKNRELMYWLTSECDKRGIWLIQMFYNIHLPKGLGIGTSMRRSQPKAADYTRKSIAKFVEEYPNVGLLVCLGEALSGKEAQVEWFTETIIPGVKDGLKARGQTELPPLVVRGHHIVEYGSHEDVLSKGKKLYPNLFSMVKYNGESLTSETPRGTYQQFHKDMAKYSGTHMANVHLLSNLEPFRYADFSFIWNSAKAIRDRLDGNGLHLYPLAYWDWPNTPDTADITQIERDRLWFEIWARYSWKLDRDPAEEREYWIGRLTDIYGTRNAAERIYAAYDASGECAPRILRRFGITGGNRQCMSLGMRLEQLTDPHKARVWQELYDSDSPVGETINQYVENECANKAHVGETPPQIIREVLAFSAEAIKEIEAASPYVTQNKEEFERLRNDMHCIEAMSKSYCAKIEATMNVVRYRKCRDKAYMIRAIPYLEESLRQYRKLEALTRDTYRYSNTFHGRQQVPWNTVYHWSQLVERYEQELADFKKTVADIDTSRPAQGWRDRRDKIKPWPGADFKLLTPGVETYKVKKGAKVFTDRNYVLSDIAPHLVGLTGMRFSHQKAKTDGIIKIEFETSQSVKVLVGYFQDESRSWLQVPMLEHVAHANERGGVEVVLEDVSVIGDGKLTLPKVNVHAFRYEAGRNTLEMIGKGSYVILGVIPAKKKSSGNVQTKPIATKVESKTRPLPANAAHGTTELYAADWPAHYAKYRPVPLTHVEARGYLGKRIDRNPASILLALKSPIPKGFEAAVLGSKPPTYRLAADSDLYKWLEGACYVFARTKDLAIKQEIDRIVALIVRCQAADGYINTQARKKRWDPNVKHDLYIAGHLFEAAAAHYRVTGEKRLLDAACAWADYLISEYKKGNPYYTTTALKEHSEYELGLLRLYRATRDRKYLDFSITLTKALCRVGPKVADVRAGGGLHAVRVGYLLASMADLYLETGSDDMLRHLPGLWEEMVNTCMYVTGAIGSHGEGISKQPYDLPHTREHPERILGETCASVAMILFSWRMHGITGESRYFDVIENTLYNHYFGAIALDGKGTFYYNPMRMIGDQSKHSDHGHRPVSSRRMLPKINRTACCPSNMWRFFGALPEYLFSFDRDGLCVNLYSTSQVNHTLSDGRHIALSVDTEYPHKGDIKIRFDGKRPTIFKLRLRIPAWSQSATAQWPGQETRSVQGGDTLVIDRTWQKDDTVQLQFDMPVRMILPNPKVKANAGQVVFARGPVLFCLEKEDVDFPVEKARVAIRPQEVTQRVGVTWHPDLLDGIHMLHVPGLVDGRAVDLKLVPWSVRANRSEDSRWLIFLPLAGATGGVKEKLAVLSEHRGPVIGPDHPDVKASNNRSGFETGQLVKHKGVYHMFANKVQVIRSGVHRFCN